MEKQDGKCRLTTTCWLSKSSTKSECTVKGSMRCVWTRIRKLLCTLFLFSCWIVWFAHSSTSFEKWQYWKHCDRPSWPFISLALLRYRFECLSSKHITRDSIRYFTLLMLVPCRTTATCLYWWTTLMEATCLKFFAMRAIRSVKISSDMCRRPFWHCCTFFTRHQTLSFSAISNRRILWLHTTDTSNW